MTKIEPIIEVKNLTKIFKVPFDSGSNLKHYFVNIFRRARGYRTFKALDGVSFTVNKGDFFGIVGRNGSGKSTLLKILAEIYTPSRGEINVKGSLMPFIELGVGFNNELTGRENVYLNGAMIGFSRKEMDDMYNEIVDFAELHDFMDEKLKNYSSGMKVRLAFSIAIRARSDILLLDEVLAVGDAAFRDKCNVFFQKQKGKRTIVLVTHDMSAVEQFCNRALLLDQGQIVKIGESSEIAMMYNDMFAKEKDAKIRAQNIDKAADRPEPVRLKSIRILQDNKQRESLEAGKNFSIEIELNSPMLHKDAPVSIRVVNSNRAAILALSTQENDKVSKLKKGNNKIRFDIQNVLSPDDYHINISISDRTHEDIILLHRTRAHSFTIMDNNWPGGLVRPVFKVTIV